MPENIKRCWNTDNPLRIKYHDTEWGVPLHDDNKFFEFLVLGGFQAGLTWWIIPQRREIFREAFDYFDPKKVAMYDDQDIERLMADKHLIRNRAKILAAINNAKCFLEVQKEFGSFDAFIWKLVNGKTLKNQFLTLEALPAETTESRKMSKELRKRGFKFVGPVICYALMQATGLVNDHLVKCFRHNELCDIK